MEEINWYVDWPESICEPSTYKKNNTGDSSEYRELNNGAPHQNPNDIISTYLNGTLIISRVGREHEGSFLCQASNGIGAGLSTLIKLTVHGK